MTTILRRCAALGALAVALLLTLTLTTVAAAQPPPPADPPPAPAAEFCAAFSVEAITAVRATGALDGVIGADITDARVSLAARAVTGCTENPEVTPEQARLAVCNLLTAARLGELADQFAIDAAARTAVTDETRIATARDGLDCDAVPTTTPPVATPTETPAAEPTEAAPELAPLRPRVTLGGDRGRTSLVPRGAPETGA